MEMSSESVSLGQKFKPVYVTQDFATVDDKKSGFPGTSTDRISLDNILTALSDKTGTTSGVPSMSHVIVMMPQSGVIELLAKVVLYPTAAKKYMWIFGEPVDVPIKTMLKLLSAHPIKTMNVAFFRYLPILHQEDCNDDSMNKLLRDTAIHFGCSYVPCNAYSPISSLRTVISAGTDQERVAILITVMNLYAHVRHYTTNYYAPHTPDILCSAIPTQTDQAGPIALNLSKELGVLHKFSGLTFYALETNADNVTRFVATARYGDNSITQTEDGVEVGKQALVSGLFPNRFRNFTNQMLTVGMVLVPPFVMDYQLSPSGYLTKARGMMIDLMDILAERFNFRYRIYPASDGHFGEFSLRGEWTGLIGDLQKKERDSAGSFLGHVLDGRLAILIAKPTTEGKLFRLFQIYQPEVMGIFVLCAIVSTAMCYLYERYSPYSLRNQITSSPPIPERFHFLEQMWNICKCSIHQCILRYPNNPSSRVVLLAQWVMIFLLFSAWQADITSFLTRSNYKPRIGSLLDLAADTTLKPLIVRGTGVYEFFQESNTKQAFQDILRRVNDENLVVPNTSTAISMLIDNPDYVVVGDYETLRYAELTYCQKLMLINTEVVMGQQSIMTLSDVDWVKPFST
ncbi:unnamed protein product [Echinostoma caproni]|uniref:Lig_chan-Glu_bd domain-containing protein n=1 Tax=Echinostoma caproni TaxID=27848 RepID=A0A183AWM2_9TREM|nr:unnamed protein product [Echinostoma caproni]